MLFKQLIQPLQLWLLSQGRCVGCGKELKDMTLKVVKGKQLVYCSCKRVYVKDGEKRPYRRALMEELGS